MKTPNVPSAARRWLSGRLTGVMKNSVSTVTVPNAERPSQDAGHEVLTINLSSLPAGRSNMPFCSVEEAIEELKKGNFIIVLDDENRENEGDLIIAAEKALRRPSTSWPSTPGPRMHAHDGRAPG